MARPGYLPSVAREEVMVFILSILLPPLLAFLIGRGCGTSPIRRERRWGIVGATLFPFVFLLILVSWYALEREDNPGMFRNAVLVGIPWMLLSTPLCFGASWFGNRVGVKVTARRLRSDRVS